MLSYHMNGMKLFSSGYLAELLFTLALMYKFGFHIWMLFDPSVTTIAQNENSRLKYIIFVSGTAILNISSMGIAIAEEPEDILLFAGLCVMIFALPIHVALFEGSVYMTSEETDSCLKCWKPWVISDPILPKD